MAEGGVQGDEDDAVTGAAASDDGLDPRFDPRFQRGYSAPQAEGGAAPAAAPAAERRGPGIDPRFDPRFQRGYDPERHEQVRRPVSADEVDDRPAFASTVKATIPRPIDTPVSRPAARTPVQPVPSTRAPAGESSSTDASVGGSDPGSAHEHGARGWDAADSRTAPAASVGRNPFLIALWIVCVALVLVGVALVVQAATTTSGGGFGISAFGDAFGVTAWAIAPIAVMVGLIGLVALTLSRALGWLAAHPEERFTAADADPDDADDHR